MGECVFVLKTRQNNAPKIRNQPTCETVERRENREEHYTLPTGLAVKKET